MAEVCFDLHRIFAASNGSGGRMLNGERHPWPCFANAAIDQFSTQYLD